jgi:hypothetical protein
MKRRELYERVWQTPLSKLGPELGFSDVGLAKLCKRYDIPVPPVGYWARLAAGQEPRRPSLPAPDDESTVYLPTARDIAHRNAARQHAQKMAEAGAAVERDVQVPVVEVRPTLEGCHAAVTKTAKFFAGIQPAIDKAEAAAERSARRGEPNFSWMQLPRTSFGRYTPDADGTLRIAATLGNIDWILRFHDALLRALLSVGCRVQARSDERSRWFEIQRSGEAVRLSFAEEFDEVPEGKRAGSHSDRLFGNPRQRYKPRDRFKLKVERQFGGLKQWVGTAAELERALPEATREIVAILLAQGTQRRVVEAEREAQRRLDEQHEVERRACLAAQQALAERKAARRAQVDRALAAAKTLEEFAAVSRMLEALEGRAAVTASDGLRAWIELVRSELTDPLDALVSTVRAETASEDRPQWWPRDEQAPDGGAAACPE